MKIGKLVLILSVFVFVSCVGPSRIVVSPDYKKQSMEGAALAVVIQDRQPFIAYKGSIEKALGKGDQQKLISEFFKKRLLKDLLREVKLKTAFFSSVDTRYLISREMLSVPEGNVVIELPAEGSQFDFSTTDADLVLFLSKIRIGTQTDEYHSVKAEQGINFTPSRSIIYQSSFVLWDNRSCQYICYGRVKSLEPITKDEASVSDWVTVSKQYVRTIFEPTGFLK
ncbi:MAG: hypothetical protein ACLFQB_05005 [Chitinispirillaceae bacterium]